LTPPVTQTPRINRSTCIPPATENAQPEVRGPDWRVAGAAVVVLACVAVLIARQVSGTQSALFVIGGALGLVLYHSMFGFASSWRRFVTDWRGDGIRVHMLLLGLTSILFLPAIAGGTLWGRAVSGSVAPVSVTVVLGAFLFGIGMQLGGG
jgi:uncharacterized protein